MAALAPAAVIESVTSMDAVFATLAVGTLVVILRGRYWLGGALVWLCSFMSYALAAVPVWAVLVIWRQRSLREAVRMTVRVAAVTIALTLVARYAFGYDLIGAFQATNHRYLYGPGSDAMHRPQSFWLFGDIAAFLFGLGVPVVSAWESRLSAAVPKPGRLRQWSCSRPPAGTPRARWNASGSF